jgi:hypothetical protein
VYGLINTVPALSPLLKPPLIVLPKGWVTITLGEDTVTLHPEAPTRFEPLGAVTDVIPEIVPAVVATTIL